MPSTIRGSDNFDSSPVKSMVRVNTANGYGSTNTVIRRFTNIVTNQGSDITYADSATNGASFTINNAGVYAISYNASPGLSNALVGASLNTSQPTTSIALLSNVSERLTMGQAYANQANPFCGWTGYLAAGSVVRAHDDGAAQGNAALYQFTITRVA